MRAGTAKRIDREASKRRDCPLRGDRLHEEYGKLKERLEFLEKLIAEAVRSHQ